MDRQLEIRRRLSAAKKSLERVERYANDVEDEWDDITSVERVTELEARGPGGFTLRLRGLGGAYLVAALALVCLIVLGAAVLSGWLPTP